ncbi:MAG: hypothetical protein QNJ12_22785 [Ilumatobacter sp.]|uniref:hypothetical protein n=1 Tax=Ilumatobacter sp. TaxID=1967498 RepID=UPI0026373CAF|nr:hypothetical protein [Ilumatobacter sp.]MDJ0771630.1 hypothetical protein [Ilumatobacter sp.]
MPDALIDLLDSSWFRVGAYAALAALAAWAGWRERRWLATHDAGWWPTYWFLSAGLLVAMGAARAWGLGERVGQIGREQAATDGWYESRRDLQALTVGVLGLIGLVAVVVAIWRLPRRRRRYLVHVFAMAGLIGFAAVRIVSLHQIDTVLYRRDVGGLRVVALVELCLLVLTVLATLMAARIRGPRSPADASAASEPPLPMGAAGSDGTTGVSR